MRLVVGQGLSIHRYGQRDYTRAFGSTIDFTFNLQVPLYTIASRGIHAMP